MSIGIYKITSPKGKIYIGQSVNIEKRWYNYLTYSYSYINQNKLKNSFNKYGSDNHIFEILEKCNQNKLNEKERYWQDYYDVIGPNGLNCILVETKELPRMMSQDIKDKIGDANRGKTSWVKGKTQSKESNLKRSKSHTGKIISMTQRLNMSNSKKKPVLQFDKQGNLIREYDSYLEAKKITKIDCQFVLVGKCKTAGGYIFKYK